MTWLLALSFALAGEEGTDIETFTTEPVPALESGIEQVEVSLDEKADADGFTPSVKRGAQQLDMDPAFVKGIQEGLEHLYRRDYPGARTFFTDLEAKFPNTGVAAVADVLVWQAMMLENFDFRYEKEYWTATKKARSDLAVAQATPGNEAWESFMLAGISGIESIFTVRKEQYIKALQLAFEAIDHVEKCRSKAPDFTDLLLADGMYNYWRTIVTRSTKLLPNFGDNRAEGIKQIQEVERNGIFVSAPATMAMVFTWHEERRLKSALAACQKNKLKYPDNVINNLLTGTTYVYMSKPAMAHKEFERVLKVDPKNERVHYWIGRAYQKQHDSDKAKDAYMTYLSFSHVEGYHRAITHYRLGRIAVRQEQYRLAEDHYKTGQKLGHKGCKKALERLRQKKREGTISY